MPNGTTTAKEQSFPDSVANTFGSISLLPEVDSATLVEFPMQKGYSTLEVLPEDFADELPADSVQPSAILPDTAQIVIPTTILQADTAQQQLQVVDSVAVALQQRPFAEFDEKVFRINYTKIGNVLNGWIFWTLLAVFVVYGTIKLMFQKRMEQVFKTMAYFNFSQKEFDRTGKGPQFVVMIIYALFSVVCGVFGLFVLKDLMPENSPEVSTTWAMVATLIVTASIFVLYVLKKVFFFLVADIFDCRPFARECIFNVYLFNRALMICLFPLDVALAFVKPSIISQSTLVIIGFIMIGAFYLYRIVREVQICAKYRISGFYIFLYLCTLEFLPILILVKVIQIIIVELGII